LSKPLRSKEEHEEPPEVQAVSGELEVLDKVLQAPDKPTPRVLIS
jgi:hypothetical protein